MIDIVIECMKPHLRHSATLIVQPVRTPRVALRITTTTNSDLGLSTFADMPQARFADSFVRSLFKFAFPELSSGRHV